jgi:hypothetical protein
MEQQAISLIFTWLVPGFIIAYGLYLTARTEILRDARSKRSSDADSVKDSNEAHSKKRAFETVPFSFARTQLMWWSLIIIPCFSISFGLEGNLDMLKNTDNTYLILLGISLGTVAAAKVIDNSDIAQGVNRHQDCNETHGFLNDIMSDENGISVHRFQAVTFNVIFGLIFIANFAKSGSFIELDTTELALMGVSSATYVGLKINENNTNNATPPKTKVN